MKARWKKAAAVLFRLRPVFYFLFVLFMYLAALQIGVFTDEMDVIAGGYNVSKGRDIYASYISQHMPFSYYMSAIPALFGARTVAQFRLGLYLILSLIWTAAYLHHRKRMHPLALWLTPVFYLSQLWRISLGSYMISDHWQGIGLVLILFELVEYIQYWTLPVSSCVFISLGIVLSFGTTFISAYAVFIFFVGVVALQLWHGWRNRKESTPEPSLPKRLWREDVRLVLICLVPFVMLGLWYAVSGNLIRFYDGAYRLNTEIYSQYMYGLGSSAGKVVPDTLRSFWREVTSSFQWILTDGVWGVWALLRVLTVIVFCVGLGVKNPIAGLTALLATIFAGVRGYSNFHGLAYIALAAAEMALCMNQVQAWLQDKKGERPFHFVCVALAVVCLHALAPNSIGNITTRGNLNSMHITNYEIYLEPMTEPGDSVYACGISFYIESLMADELVMEDGSMAVTNPWFYTMYGSEAMQSLIEKKPKIVLTDQNGVIWGIKYTDYAAEFVDYISEHYTQIYDELYVRNDYLQENKAMLQDHFSMVGTAIGSGADENLVHSAEELEEASEEEEEKEPVVDTVIYPRMLDKGETIGQTFIAEGREMRAISLCLATYRNRNPGGLTVRVIDPETRNILSESRVESREITDNYSFRIVLRAALETGKQYLIEVQTDEAGRKTYLAPRVTFDGTATGETHAVIGGEAQPFSLWLRVEYGYDLDTMEILE